MINKIINNKQNKIYKLININQKQNNLNKIFLFHKLNKRIIYNNLINLINY